MKIGCVIMAAGNGSRFGENKLAVDFHGKSLIERTFQAVPQGVFHQVVVVTQYQEIGDLARKYGFSVVENIHPEWGISHTICLGTQQLEHCQGILYLVSDQPRLNAETVRRVAEKWLRYPKNIIAVSAKGKRGNPCLFPQAFFRQLEQLEGDTGGNVILKANLDLVKLVEASPEELEDVDTPEQLANI